MITVFEPLGVMSTADDTTALLLRTTQQEFPVLDGASRLRGVVTRKAIIEGLRDTGGATPVLQMKATEVPVVPQSEDLSAAVALLQESSARFVGVVDAAGRLVGYLTPESLSELLMLRSSREK